MFHHTTNTIDIEGSVEGGGKEHYPETIDRVVTSIQSYKISSTRMEALAMPVPNTAAKFIDPDKLLDYCNCNHCDSEAAINTYKKLQRLNRLQFPKLPNADVWSMIRTYQLNWGSIQLAHVPSHMDSFVEDLDAMLPEWIMNVLADGLCDDKYDEDVQSISNKHLAKHSDGHLFVP